MEVIEAPSGGWIITEPDEKGRLLYVGRDRYWTRVISVALPFKERVEAEEAKEGYSGDTRRFR